MGYNFLELPNNNEEELPDGLIVVHGRNSHGKSTILEGIIYAFFGANAFRGKKASSFITYGESETEIYVYFTLDKKNYYIYRKWSRSKANIAFKLFKMNTTTRNFEEIKEFDIPEFFEITQDQALNTVFVKQGEIEELSSKKGATVRDMILKLFQIDIIDKTLTFLDKEKSQTEASKEDLQRQLIPIPRIESEIEELTKEINDNEAVIKNKIEKKQDNERKLSNLPSQDLISSLRELIKKNTTNRNTFETYQQNFMEKIKETEFSVDDTDLEHKIELKIKEFETSSKDLGNKGDELQKVLNTKNSEKGEIQASITENESKIKKMNESLSFTEKKIAKCPLCQNELSKEHYDEIVHDLENRIKTNSDQLEEIKLLIETHQSQIDENRVALDKIKEELTSLKSIKTDFHNFTRCKEEYTRSEDELQNFLTQHDKVVKALDFDKLDSLSLEIQKLQTGLESINREIKEKHDKNIKNEKSIKTKKEEIVTMEELQKSIDDLEVDSTHITKVKEFVRRFVTEYMVTKRLIKNIALKAEKYIKEFTLGQYGSLMIDLEGKKKTGLSLSVKDHFNGVFESTEMLSGGDRTSLGMALRLAISELMKVIRPTKDSPKNYPKIDFLLLDEPLAALDEERRKRILSHLVRSTAFSQVFLITHTAIPSEIQTHKISVSKNQSTGISTARFERQISTLEL
jgi:exonuclease SbcC